MIEYYGKEKINKEKGRKRIRDHQPVFALCDPVSAGGTTDRNIQRYMYNITEA